jgi:adenine-specific DNA-methyltransferase
VSRLTDLIAQVKAKAPQLGTDLDREFKVLSSRLPFGLNFERHRPEIVELPQRPIRKGDKVHVLPKRGSTKKGDQRLWQVKAIRRVGKGKVADLDLLETAKPESQSMTTDDLVVVAAFRDTIYPGLISTGKVLHGSDKPFHTVINGENYHVLKALTYTHRGKVDAIYIDPPYNTGAKDWKYDNDYVESDDLYRHSKWLAMMERRLLVARELLNPANSVLIVTIDEKEYLRLGLLLEQLFPEAAIQMVSSVINPKGTARTTYFSRTDEFIFTAFFGRATVPDRSGNGEEMEVRWRYLRRTDVESARTLLRLSNRRTTILSSGKQSFWSVVSVTPPGWWRRVQYPRSWGARCIMGVWSTSPARDSIPQSILPGSPGWPPERVLLFIHIRRSLRSNAPPAASQFAPYAARFARARF